MSSINTNSDSDSDTSTVPLFDPSEFPSLTDTVSQTSSTRGVQYGGIMTMPSSEIGEFVLLPEDFPPLPGSYSQDGSSPGSKMRLFQSSGASSETNDNWRSVSNQESSSDSEKEQGLKKGLDKVTNFLNNMIFNGDSDEEQDLCETKSSKPGINFVDDKATNIPKSMINDQFGVAGLLRFIKTTDSNPGLATLGEGDDITTLGLNLDSPGYLYPTFGGPWAEEPCEIYEDDFQTPPEYVFNCGIRCALAPGRAEKCKEELLLAALNL